MGMDTISLRKKFALFDRDGDGIITVEDLRRFLKSMGQNAADLDVEKLITAFDVNYDGKISFEEFCTLSTFSLSGQDQELALMEVFRQFDKDGNGYIDVQEMRNEVRSLLGRTLSEKEVVEMFRIADADGNDQLDYQEFVKVIMAKSAEAVEPLESQVPSSLVGFSFIDGISEQSWNFVEQLCQQAHSHQALNHLYLQRLAMGELPDVEGALKDYAIQYSEYSGNFQQYLNLALSNLEKREHKQLVSDNYKEERGYVDEHHQKQLTDLGIELEWIQNVPHTVLFRRFQKALGISGSEQQPTCSEAKQFHEKIQDICSEDAASAIGAIGLAGELGVSQIYRYILEAIKRHTPLAPREYVFFTLHTQMDDEHWHSLKAIGADLANSAENQQKLRSSMEAALEARCKFWDALLERALKMPEKQNILLPPSQLYELNSQKWVRQEPSCLSDFTARPAIFNLCEPVRNAMVLDLGCGEGYCSRELMRRGASKVIGVDISANLIAAAQMEEADEPLGITYLTGNSTKSRLSFVSESVNVVLTSEGVWGSYKSRSLAVARSRDGAYKLEGAIGEVSSPIQVPRLGKPQKTAPHPWTPPS